VINLLVFLQNILKKSWHFSKCEIRRMPLGEKIICKNHYHLLESAGFDRVCIVQKRWYKAGRLYRINLINGRKQSHRTFVRKIL